MKVLIFDTETTGLLPKWTYYTPITNYADHPALLKRCPHIVQCSYVICDCDNLGNNSLGAVAANSKIIVAKNHIIKLPSGIRIPEEVSNIHHITDEISAEQGILIEDVLREFVYYLRKVDLIVCHNVDFDAKMLQIEMIRAAAAATAIEPDALDLLQYFLNNSAAHYCTMKQSTSLCNLVCAGKHGNYVKYPKLSELYTTLFSENVIEDGLHDSFVDVLVTYRCFVQLRYFVDIGPIHKTPPETTACFM